MNENLRYLLKQDESETLDFKRELPLRRDKQRKELAKDICCFANTSGGFIIIGVEDTTKNRIGIPPGTLDVKQIMKIGRDRIVPPVHKIKAEEVEHEGLTYGFISIERTNQVHQTQGVTYVRRMDDCLKADAVTISELVQKSKDYAIEEAQRRREMELAGFSEIESKRAEEILDRLLEQFYGDGFMERLDSKRQERRWIVRRMVADELKSFTKACTVTIDPKSDISEQFLDILRTRSIGMLAMAQLVNDPTDTQKTRIVIEYDPTIVNEGEDERSAEFLFEWAEKFKNTPRSTFTQSLSGIIEESLRIQQQLILQNEFLDLTKNIHIDGVNPFTMLWAMLVALANDSILDLTAGKSKWAATLKKRVKRIR